MKGQINRNWRLIFKVDLVIEFDERQHFTPPRAASLLAYPDDVEWVSTGKGGSVYLNNQSRR